MNTQKLILSSIDPEVLQEMMFKAAEAAFIKHKEKESEKEDEQLLTRKEVAAIYKTSFVTLRQWEIDKIIPTPIRKGSRVYFRKSDIYNDINSKSTY